MRRRNKFLFICLGAVVMLGVLITVHHFQVKSKVERYKAELRAQGEALEWEDLLGDPTPRELNGAPLFKELSSRLPQSGVLATNNISSMIMVARGQAMPGWAQPRIGYLSLEYSNSWVEAFADYDSQRDIINQFHGILSKPILDFDLDYSQGWSLLIPHLAPMRNCAHRLASASACELRLGNSSAAVTHLRVMLALVKGSEQEPFLISQLLRIRIASIAGGATWDLLQSGDATDTDLELLQRAWSDLEFMASLELTVMGGRCLSLQTMDQMRSSPQEFRRVAGIRGGPFAPGGGWKATSGNLLERGVAMAKQGFDGTKAGLAEGAWRTSWSFTDEVEMLKRQNRLLEVVRLAIQDQHAGNAIALERKFKEEGQIPPSSGGTFFGLDVGNLPTLFSGMAVPLFKAFSRSLAAETNARIAMTAVALERYRLRHGAYPEKLESLVPAFVVSVPRDPIDGAPLRYRPLPDGGFLLYSIGEDLVDNGGSLEPPDGKSGSNASHWLHGRDWVWPHPANREEVLAWWKEEVTRGLGVIFPDALPGKIDHTTGLPISYMIQKPSADPTNAETATVTDESSEMMSDEEVAKFVDDLGTRWTDLYFHALTNRGASPTVEDSAIDQRP